MRWRASLVCLLVIATACTPTVQRSGSPNQPPKLTHDFLIAADGKYLPVRRWLPKGRLRAVIIGVHGMNDHSNAFALPAKAWRRSDIATYAYDQRGFGGTVPRGIWASVGTMVRDFRTVITLVRKRHPGVPVYAVGVSMGAAVTMAGAAGKDAPPLAGIVLVAPAVRDRASLPLFYRVLLWTTAHTVPGLTLTGRNIDRVPSDNIPMLRAMGRDVRVIKGVRIDALYGLVNLMDAALASVKSIKTPILLLYGEKDQFVPRTAVRDAIARLPRAKLRTAIYAEGYHMLLRDLQRAVVHRDIASWILSPSAPLPSGADRRDVARLLADKE